MNVGIIGRGFVGNAIFQGLNHYYDMKVYDVDSKKSTHEFNEVINCDERGAGKRRCANCGAFFGESMSVTPLECYNCGGTINTKAELIGEGDQSSDEQFHSWCDMGCDMDEG